MAVVAVFNQKGGVGKTTTTLNLLAALVRRGNHPLGIDLDPQAHLTLASGLKSLTSDETVYAFYQQQKPLSQLLRECAGGMYLIPAHMELFKIDSLYGRNPNITSVLKSGLAQEGLAEGGAPVLIDCSPMLGVLSLNAVFAARRLLIPVSADYLSLQGVNRLDAALSVLEKPLGKRVERRIVLTRFDARRRLSFEIQDKLRAHYGQDLCETRISETVTLAECPLHGRDIFSHAPNSQGSRDYHALAEELTGSGFFN